MHRTRNSKGLTYSARMTKQGKDSPQKSSKLRLDSRPTPSASNRQTCELQNNFCKTCNNDNSRCNSKCSRDYRQDPPDFLLACLDRHNLSRSETDSGCRKHFGASPFVAPAPGFMSEGVWRGGRSVATGVCSVTLSCDHQASAGFAGLRGQRVQNAHHRQVSCQNSDCQYCHHRKRKYESTHQTAQVSPAFQKLCPATDSADLRWGPRILNLPVLTLAAVAN